MASPQKTSGQPEAEQRLAAPSISLPKGGGAIRGLGEKFAANPVTGTGSMSVPIAVSSGRSGFGPQLSLSYDSGAGNGPFGFGWSLSLPSITRKTDKGLPQYRDAEESDVFLLSGAEDLVPVLTQESSKWVLENVPDRIVDNRIYNIKRFRPRTEGLFARIERWSNKTKPADIFWRSISKDNITTWYGKTEDSRIADGTRIFSWLICESYDDKGNVIVYRYKPEDSQDIDQSQAHERNRTPDIRKTNRYLKRIRYGNHEPYFPELLKTEPSPTPAGTTALDGSADWFFEVVFDYGEHDLDVPMPEEVGKHWPRRNDPFSSYRAGFEVRTYRLCQRVLMFHHFVNEPGVGQNCLVRSTDFNYSYEEGPANAQNPIFSYLLSVSQSGYKRKQDGYLKKSLPPLEFGYSEVPSPEQLAGRPIHGVDVESLENLPVGLDGAAYQWIDLNGDGTSGILTDQADGWYYKRNLSANNQVRENTHQRTVARFGSAELVASKPAVGLASGGQFLDLAGDGQLDLVHMEGSLRGFYERIDDSGWGPFKPFVSSPDLPTRDPDLKFVDLTGDGHADILITESEVLTWYPSLAEQGFARAGRVSLELDEEKSPRLVFGDGTESIYLADLSGDGLTDLVRIRNGEVCYWPNLGYGHFGAKVTMDNAPWFDSPDQFDQVRIRLADTDGSGTTDILYLGRDGVHIYFNQSGNRWSDEVVLPQFPSIDSVSSVHAVDLLGNGTACLVWSSPLPAAIRRPMRYLALMEEKPHLLIGTKNNLGAETRVHYAPSTKFYLDDKASGRPWITRLPFPMHVLERVETFDHISRNYFVTQYSYHHGYFDGEEREFRGFAMVEQRDTEEFAALTKNGALPETTNVDLTSHVPPVLTKTWFHTGAFLDGEKVSQQLAHEYYGAPKESDPQFKEKWKKFEETLLPDTVLIPDLTVAEGREACRALRGSMLRQEVYALDGTDKEEHPYTVTEQNFAIQLVQPTEGNRHSVFFTHAHESISYHYERDPVNPRIQHALSLEVDDFGDVLKSVAIGYGRLQKDASLSIEDQKKQTQPLITYTENQFTNTINTNDDYRTPLPAATRTYELTGYVATGLSNRFQISDFVKPDPNNDKSLIHVFKNEVQYEEQPVGSEQRRLIEHVRTLYRANDLTGLLKQTELQSRAIPGESYKLAFTPGLLTDVFGTKVTESILTVDGGYVHNDDNQWWIPSGKVFFDVNADVMNPSVTASEELAEARAHFYVARKFADPFNQTATVDYDVHDLAIFRTEDALHNRVTAQYDYRVLQPRTVTDPNGNRIEVAFDALGMVAGTAVMGKVGEPVGDLLDASFDPDVSQAQLDAFITKPREPSSTSPDESVVTQICRDLLGNATTRVVYDLDRFKNLGEPPFAATLSRETHYFAPGGNQTKIQISFSYSDGFGRETQKKIQAESGTVVENGPVVNPRWVGSGWTIFNNKGKPVRQYEPFFSATHSFEFAKVVGVSPILFYDPVERVVATLHPNHTWEKVVFDPWQQISFDVNDTVTFDPKTDPNVSVFFNRLPDTEHTPTWYQQRVNGAMGTEAKSAADKAALHADTPGVAHFDSLGRTFLTIAHNKFVRNGATKEEKYSTRVVFDIEGNQREVIDAKDRIVMRYDYDMLGNGIHQSSMEAGERWLLNDVAGKPIRAWDSRDHEFSTRYDVLRRPTESFLRESDGAKLLVGRTVYGETQVSPETNNLRGRVIQIFDQAGVVTSDAYDFKGNPVRNQRQLAKEYKTKLDWSVAVSLADEMFSSSTRYDALNRPSQLIAPHSNHANATVNIIQPVYNEANLLEATNVWLQQADAPANLLPANTADLHAVANIDYNAKGQRTLIEYGNGARTTYTYDRLTFHLSSLKTTQGGALLQDLSYTYDPGGNITHIRDDAQQTIFFNNSVVEPHCHYTYDAIYRLIEARGREHIGQSSPPQPTTWDDAFRINLSHPNDGQAVGQYSEQYEYDEVGNFLNLIHKAVDGSWTRSYEYQTASQIESAKKSNRVSNTAIGSTSESYSYDAHGSMLKMLHLPTMQWDFRDQLEQVDLLGGGMAYYVYDAAGQRVRKIREHNGGIVEERIYLGGFEIYRKRNGSGPLLERETLHLMDDQKRIALVETLTDGNDGSPPQLIRYQFDNHLGSVSLELDQQGKIISYEEYYPYGSTSYQAVSKEIQVPVKRYRFTGKERDEETGLNYHGARYYAPWLGRWITVDPLGMVDGPNPYRYVSGNPVRLVDSSGQQSTSADEEKYGQSMACSGVCPGVNSQVLLTGQTSELPYAYNASSRSPRVSFAQNTGGGGGASGAGEDAGFGGTYGVSPTLRDENGGYSIALPTPELTLYREGPKNEDEALALGARLAVEGEIMVLAGEYRIAAMLLGGGLMMSENQQDFSMGSSLFIGGLLGAKPDVAKAEVTAAPKSVKSAGEINEVAVGPKPEPPVAQEPGLRFETVPAQKAPLSIAGAQDDTVAGVVFSIKQTSGPAGPAALTTRPKTSSVMGMSAHTASGRPGDQYLHLGARSLGFGDTSANLAAGGGGANRIMMPFEKALRRIQDTRGGVSIDVQAYGYAGTDVAEYFTYKAWVGQELVLDVRLSAYEVNDPLAWSWWMRQ
jgi:RHS repeat-associated protein